jgi:V-type H+-transporting ATPase subunit E
MLDPEKEKISKKIFKELEEFKVKVKIQESQKKNKLRLEKLKIKIDYVNNIIEEAKGSLIEKVKDKSLYRKVMTKLIIQGLIKLLETDVNLVVKKEDISLVKEIIGDAKKEFENMMSSQTIKYKNLQVNITVDDKYFLPDYIIGGVMITAMKSKIRVDNTLDKRLELLKQAAIPEIRKILFKD